MMKKQYLHIIAKFLAKLKQSPHIGIVYNIIIIIYRNIPVEFCIKDNVLLNKFLK